MEIQKENILSITEARGRLFNIYETVTTMQEVFGLTLHGNLEVVILSATEYEKLTKGRKNKAGATKTEVA
jgi:PHD/YefM family antitoxin component YafN of YafNO toxin-antitoxin module